MRISPEAYSTVNHYITTEYGAGSVNDNQVHAITKEAFKHLKYQHEPSLKNWGQQGLPDEIQKQKLISAVKRILVSPDSPWKPAFIPGSKLQTLILDILRGKPPPAKELIKEKELLKAVIWKKNPVVLAEVRLLLNRIFEDMDKELQRNNMAPDKNFHMEMIIGDLLSLYPYLRPENGEIIKIPMIINGKWKLADYSVEKIKLTPKWMGSPLVAYGLNPKKDSGNPPLLLFKGTTYTTDKGFSLSLLTDINPLGSVGSYAFHLGKNKIGAWLKEHTADGKIKAVIYGKSLGGALAWHSGLYFPNQVGKVMSYGAPGFSFSDLSRLKKVLTKGSPPEINIFCQKGDPVPYFDLAAKKGVNYFQVITDKPHKGILAHADMYSSHEKSSIIRLDASRESKQWKRVMQTAFRGVLSMYVFPVFLIAHAANTGVRKSVRLIDKHIVKGIGGNLL